MREPETKEKELTAPQRCRVEHFKDDLRQLLEKHNVRFDFYAGHDETVAEFHFMTSDPSHYNGETYSDICLDAFEVLG